MTYKNLVDTLQTVISTHKLINQYSFGNLSDIQTPDNGSPNYPYGFLRPVNMQVGQYSQQFSFELILMDYCFDTMDGYIDGSSRMLQILADIIAEFRITNNYRQYDIQLSVTAVPFKERFKDSVVGITASITIDAAEPLDGCFDMIP